jgi:hypothetical protein
MHQTTVRFGPDLWDAMEAECARLGVSAAQYLREAALARLAYTAGRRGDREYELALVGAGGRTLGERSAEQILAAAAVTAQSELVWRKAREVRAKAAELRLQGRRSGK